MAQDPPRNRPSHEYVYRGDIRAATTNCNSDMPQVLGPGWNGSFSSNSADGVYPTQTRSCTWTMLAYTNASTPAPTSSSSTLAGSEKSSSTPYIIQLTFWSPIQLVCGIDYLTLYDGPDTSSPVIAKLCGNIWMDSVPTLYSSGPVMTAVFTTQEQTPGSVGFTAGWTSVYFTPRSQHAMAYDSAKDTVYISGGTSSQTTFMSDLLSYNFATNTWKKLTVTSRTPDPRYGHFAFVYDSDLYIYGGVSIIGGMGDIWKFNGKQWAQLQLTYSDQLPAARIGAACVVVTTNNSTQLAVFGGMNAAGETMRDINMYDVGADKWKKAARQNSVGLAGATAVYHKATESIYFFGGMVNQTTRNVITYQYFLEQGLWYALAPRIDPLTATPMVTNDGQPSDNGTDSGEDDSGDGSQNSMIAPQNLPPVLYDPVSGVWAPAGLMGDDMVLIYGGMRPYGLGLSAKAEACYVGKVSIYDLSCQRWTSYDVSDTEGIMRNRVNHTMVLRPPGSTGGSKTAWTMYIFGGFDGKEHQDMLNFTLGISTPAPADLNNCRALRWCSYYDDCQDCNDSYCSYINGLCLFDTDKAKASSAASATSPAYLLGNSSDIPMNGTLQDLIRQRPELKGQVLTPDTCPTHIALDLNVSYSYTMQPGQSLTFKTYIDAQDLDIRFSLLTSPSLPMDFASQNVWEGFMNMYWRATHGLTDDSWNGYSETSSPIPTDVPTTSDNITVGDSPVITLAGILNTSELLNRWTKYSGLDASASSSALRQSTSTVVDFAAGDPRRFSGYYVYRLKNSNSVPIAFTLTVSLLDHPEDDGGKKGSQFNLATLGFMMVGFIFGVILLVLVGYKIKKRLNEREQIRRARTELRMLAEEEEEEEERRRQGVAQALAARDDQSLANMKPMYRVVVGVQQDQKDVKSMSTAAAGVESNTLRHRHVRSNCLGVSTTGAGVDDEKRDYRARPDYICNLEASPPSSSSGIQSKEPKIRGSLKHRWSLKSLGRSSSLKRFRDHSAVKSEDEEGLTDNGYDDIAEELPTNAEMGAGVGASAGSTRDEEQQVLELGLLSPQGLTAIGNEGIKQRQHRNPTKVQPISIEPLVFHGELVPRTKRNFRRYRRSLAQQPQSVSDRRTSVIPVRTPSRRSAVMNTRTTSRVKGALRRAQTVAASLTARSRGGGSTADRDMGGQVEHSEGIEMEQFEKPSHEGTHLPTYVGEDAIGLRGPRSEEVAAEHAPVRMRGRQEYEPGPLVAVNVLVVFPGDASTRPLMILPADSETGTLSNTTANVNVETTQGAEQVDQCLPPMAIGTVFVPDPVRWWAYKARQRVNRRRYEREMRRLRRHKELYPEKATY
ncbi:Multiple epidermal growth factor-like domains protein 8 [Gamsiella multidivaricata]|nr:Multiple epidermal growth factor-like domains protein 8 [Gamsiella multidivaricata]